MIHLVTFGIIIDDIVFPDGTTRMGVLGGGGPQTAWGMAAALGSGESVGLAAGVGRDLDDEVLAPLRAAGVNLDGLRRTDLPTPRAWQVLEHNGQRTQVWRMPLQVLGQHLARSWEAMPESYHHAGRFHWGFHPDDPRSVSFAQELTAAGRRVSLEPFRPPDQPLDATTLRAILAACEVFSPNWREAVRIVGNDDEATVLRHFREHGARIVAIRRGAQGADVWDMGAGRGLHVPAVKTNIVDVVGAGNAFCGALLARLDEGMDVAACHASAAASYLVEQVGLPATLPDPAAYQQRVAEARAGLRTLSLP